LAIGSAVFFLGRQQQPEMRLMMPERLQKNAQGIDFP
jgi:hypothetical protein